MYEAITIPEVMFQPSRLRLRHYLDRLLYGLVTQPMQSVDPFVTVGVRQLFLYPTITMKHYLSKSIV